MAMEEAAKIGINIDSKIIDTQNDIKEIENQLKLIDTLALDLIVGPLLPKNFNIIASSQNSKFAAIENKKRNFLFL